MSASGLAESAMPERRGVPTTSFDPQLAESLIPVAATPPIKRGDGGVRPPKFKGVLEHLFGIFFRTFGRDTEGLSS
jgi:hypothetical protein